MRLVNDTDREYWEVDFRRYGKVEQEDLVVCPYCFEERELHIDEFEYEDEYKEEEYCEECGKTFIVEKEVRYEFWSTTKRID